MEFCQSKITIAVDGFSSCGKSTFAKAIAAKLGYIFIDSGAMYRAVTLYAIGQNAVINNTVDEPKLISVLDNIRISFRFNTQRAASDIYLNDQNVEQQIRTIQVSDAVSSVSRIGEVRKRLVAMQQLMGKDKGIVMDGRDIGTVVFPDAELKIFMTADPAIRAQRRYAELKARGDDVSLEQIEKNIRDRDTADQSREIAPLKPASDAIILDNSHLSVEQQMEWVSAQLTKLGICI